MTSNTSDHTLLADTFLEAYPEMADYQPETTYQVTQVSYKRPLSELGNLEAPKSPQPSTHSEESDSTQVSPAIELPPRKKQKVIAPSKSTANSSTPFPHQAPGKDWSLVTKDGPLLVKKHVMGHNKIKKTMKLVDTTDLTDYKNRNPFSFKYIFKCKDFKAPTKTPLVHTAQVLPSKFNLIAQEVIKKGDFIMELDFKLTTKASTSTNSMQISQTPPLVVQFCDEPDKAHKGSHLGAFLRDDRATRNVDIICLMTDYKYPTILLLARKDIQTFEPLTVDFNMVRTAHSN